MSEQKLKLGYRMFYASVWDIRDQKHSVAILCGPNGEGCFASPLNPAKAFEPGATGSQWGVTGHDATDKFLTDLSAFEAKSRKSEIVAGPGPEPSQAKQDAKDLRRIASYSPDDDPDKTVMLAIADRLDAAACEAGMVGMGFTPTTDAADAEPGWILRKENERLRKELKSALACARSWHATVQETEKILERTADERNAAKADLAAVRRTLQTIGSLPADLQNLTVKLEAVEAENERLRKQLAERTDLHHAAREGKDTYKKRAVSAEARLKELESKAPAMAADVMQQLKASEAELARLRPVVDAACEWAKARMEYSAFNNTPERRAAIESSGQRLYVA
ncbi:MAG: hypothetical protein IMZ57_06920, partial [Acidobacteria bacterium]|nr:hypothetical protein [Acidobacteriota bacterium]